MKTILEGRGRTASHTRLGPLFDVLGDRLRRLRWWVAAVERNGPAPGLPLRESDPPVLVDGRRLAAIAFEHDPQFLWGVFSGFEPGTEPDPVRFEAERGRATWPELADPTRGPVSPGAAIEIVAFDSTCTLVTSLEPEVHSLLRAGFPEAKSMPPLVEG